MTSGGRIQSASFFSSMKALALGFLTLIPFLSPRLSADPGEWIELFDGKSLEGWHSTSAANWEVQDGVITVSEGPAGFLTCETGLDRYELEVEFRSPQETNSGVFVGFDEVPTDPAIDCYEINIAPLNNPFPTGSIVTRAKVAPAVTADQWHRFVIQVKDGTVKVCLDGAWIVEHAADPVASGGWIGLQMREGAVAFRGIRVREIP